MFQVVWVRAQTWDQLWSHQPSSSVDWASVHPKRETWRLHLLLFSLYYGVHLSELLTHWFCPGAERRSGQEEEDQCCQSRAAGGQLVPFKFQLQLQDGHQLHVLFVLPVMWPEWGHWLPGVWWGVWGQNQSLQSASDGQSVASKAGWKLDFFCNDASTGEIILPAFSFQIKNILSR